MRQAILDIALGLCVLCGWIGTFAFLRFGSVLDRLHCTTFVIASSGPLLVLAALLQEGATSRSLKIAFLVVLLLGAGAVLTHAAARALFLRNGPNA